MIHIKELYLFQREQRKKITKAVSSAGVSCTIQSCIFPGHLMIILCWFNSSEVRGCSYSSMSWQGYLCENGLAGIGQYFACAFSLLFFFRFDNPKEVPMRLSGGLDSPCILHADFFPWASVSCSTALIDGKNSCTRSDQKCNSCSALSLQPMPDVWRV